MSLVTILDRYALNGRHLLFILNGEASSDKTSFYSLTDKGSLRTFNLDSDEINLYNAIRGYLDKKKIKYKSSDKRSEDFLLVLDNEQIYPVLGLIGEISKNNHLEEMTHSPDAEFKDKLKSYALDYD